MPEVLSKDGFLVDEETGEIIGHVDLKKDWHPETEEEVERVLSHIGDVDALIVAVKARIEARVSNLKKQLEGLERRRLWLETRYITDLKRYGEQVLSHGGKYKEGTDWPKKSLQLEHGKLMFRFPTSKARPKIVVEDGAEEEAINWLEAAHASYENFPDAVKVRKSILTTPLQDVTDLLPNELFSLEWPTPSFKIETGVGKEINHEEVRAQAQVDFPPAVKETADE